MSRKILSDDTLDATCEHGRTKLRVKVLGPESRSFPTKAARANARKLQVVLYLNDPNSATDDEIHVACSELSTVIGRGINRVLAEGVLPR